MSPTEVWAILLDEGRYLGSLPTFYWLLREASGTRERRGLKMIKAGGRGGCVAEFRRTAI